MLFILPQRSVNQCVSHIMAHRVPCNPTSYHFVTLYVLVRSVLVTLTHTLTHVYCNIQFVRKKLNIMTIVSGFTGFIVLKVKQNYISSVSRSISAEWLGYLKEKKEIGFTLSLLLWNIIHLLR